MNYKATLYIQKTMWVEHVVEVDCDPDTTIDEAIYDAFEKWSESQEDYNDARVEYVLDDWGYEENEE